MEKESNTESNLTNGDQSPAPKAKRHRRTKAEMQAARAAGEIPGSKNEPKPVDPSPGFTGTDRAAGEEVSIYPRYTTSGTWGRHKGGEAPNWVWHVTKHTEKDPIGTSLDTEYATQEEALAEVARLNAAEEVSIENKDSEHARNLEAVKKGVMELQNFVVERKAIGQLQPLIDQINHGFDAADEQGRALLYTVRATGVMLLEWKAQAGHGNWMDAYETSGFHKSIDTAENWMRLSLMTDAQIAEVTSVREALNLLKDKKARKKGTGGNPNPGLDDDGDAKDNGDTNEGDTGTSQPDPESKPEPEFELTLLDELEMVMKRVCAEHPREEVARMVASMLNDYYQPKEEAIP